MNNQSSNSLGYQAHTNLSINIKTPDECENLLDIRYEIDTIDHFIIKLMDIRMKYALATLKFKLDGKPIPDNQRIIQQLKQRKIWAKQYGLDQVFIQYFFKLMIDWYMTQQIIFYQNKNKKSDQLSLQIKFLSLPQLKAMEFNLDWINISQYQYLLNSAYRKSKKVNEPILVSFTQKTSLFLNIHPFTLFEHAHQLSLTNAFLLAKPSEKIFILTFGSVKHFHIDENIYSSNIKLKEIINNKWKHLLSNAIIQSSSQNNIPGNGPILTGGIPFQSSQSNKWSNFNKTSFVLPQIQFNSKDGQTYITFNTIINNYDQMDNDNDILFIDKQLISLLELSNQLFNNIKQYSNEVNHLSFNSNNDTETNLNFQLSSDILKETISDGIQQINKKNLQKIVLAHQIEIKNNNEQNLNSLLNNLHLNNSSSYIYGLLREDTSFIGTTYDQLIKLFNKQFQSTFSMSKINQLFNSKEQQNLIVDWIKNKINSISQLNSIVLYEKIIDQEYLYTIIESIIEKEITLLDLLEILYPIPTITGFPLNNSLEFIEEKEYLDRGWFTAPIGWIDSNGNGLFIIAFKSILINKDLITLFDHFNIINGENIEEKLKETIFNMKNILSMFNNKQIE